MTAGVAPVSSGTTEQAEARFASLDGLRAISIAMVLLAHVHGTAGFPAAAHEALDLVALGRLGVRVFFVISGFLITSLLLREVERTGTVDLRQFYFRRTLRIFPAYYAFIACMALAWSVGLVALQPGDLGHALTYTINYHATHAWTLGHAWSLSVEEQFYLLWPAIILLVGPRRGFMAAGALVLVAPLIRIGRHLIPGEGLPVATSFETVADAIAVGCLLAGVRHRLWMKAPYRRVLASRWFACVPLGVLALMALPELGERNVLGLKYLYLGFFDSVGVTLVSVGIALCIDWAMRNADGVIGRILNARPMVQIGVLSYSLYLWQQPFLNRHVDSTWTRFPLNLVLVALLACASYYAVERPALRMRDAFARRRRAGVPGLAVATAGVVGLSAPEGRPRSVSGR